MENRTKRNEMKQIHKNTKAHPTNSQTKMLTSQAAHRSHTHTHSHIQIENTGNAKQRY